MGDKLPCYDEVSGQSLPDGIEHFIYASSGSVYGLKDEDQVREDLELFPCQNITKQKWLQNGFC